MKVAHDAMKPLLYSKSITEEEREYRTSVYHVESQKLMQISAYDSLSPLLYLVYSNELHNFVILVCNNCRGIPFSEV